LVCGLIKELDPFFCRRLLEGEKTESRNPQGEGRTEFGTMVKVDGDEEAKRNDRDGEIQIGGIGRVLRGWGGKHFIQGKKSRLELVFRGFRRFPPRREK